MPITLIGVIIKQDSGWLTFVLALNISETKHVTKNLTIYIDVEISSKVFSTGQKIYYQFFKVSRLI